MARETLFEEQEITGFGFAEQYGMYAKSIIPAPFALTVGENYIVAWDDDEYPVTAVDISALFPGGIAVGNGSGFGLPGNNEPFIVAVFETDITLFVLDPTDTRDTHSFGAYKEIEEETPVNIILRNPMGEEEEYPLRQMIELDTTDGNTALYSKGEVLDSITIEPDFSAGDMTVTAPDGYLVQSTVIAKPENLKPENIAKNKVVAGIVGAHEGGGGVSIVPYVKTRGYSKSFRSTTSSGDSMYTISLTLPANATVYTCGATYAYQSYSSSSKAQTKEGASASQFNTYSGYLKGIPTVTKTDSSVTVEYSINYSYTGYSYGIRLALYMFVGFSTPDVNIAIRDDGYRTLIVDGNGEISANYEPIDYLVNELDLRGSTRTYLSGGDWDNWQSVSVIRVSPTMTQVFSSKFTGVPIKTLDFSLATSVPSLQAANIFPNKADGFEILVPAALYDEWIAATNWSSLADNIVAV